MSTADAPVGPTEPVGPSGPNAPGEPVGPAEPVGPTEPVQPRQSKQSRTSKTSPDPLRGSRTSGFWTAVIGLIVVLVLLAIFVLQNTSSVEITFLVWDGTAPLAAALLIATAAGLAIAASAGTLRILQLRRRVKRDRR